MDKMSTRMKVKINGDEFGERGGWKSRSNGTRWLFQAGRSGIRIWEFKIPIKKEGL